MLQTTPKKCNQPKKNHTQKKKICVQLNQKKKRKEKQNKALSHPQKHSKKRKKEKKRKGKHAHCRGKQKEKKGNVQHVKRGGDSLVIDCNYGGLGDKIHGPTNFLSSPSFQPNTNKISFLSTFLFPILYNSCFTPTKQTLSHRLEEGNGMEWNENE